MAAEEKILVVDDDENMRVALKEALMRSGYGVDIAADPTSGMRMMDANPYRLVVTDVRMPKKSGLELLSEIKEKHPQTAVILITAYGTIDTAVEALKNGADDYLLKPFSADTLDEVVKRVLDGGEAKQVKPVIAPPPPRPVARTRQGVKRTIVTQNKKMEELLEMAERTAPSTASVLIQGGSGTGKELVARFIHEKSDRSSGTFVAINCAALPESLLESELFGHEKGAFTGAIARKIGKFELATGGTILLDEITEMDMALQAKLLRVLQEKEIDRVGGMAPVPIDVRVIATTNREIDEYLSEGKFREDLYFRLNVIPLKIPTLRERMDDLPILIDYFLKKFARESGREARELSPKAMDLLKGCRWKGNIRELENVMERAGLLCRTSVIQPEDLLLTEPAAGQKTELVDADEIQTVAEMERKLILGTLEKAGSNRTQAAEMLGISIRTLRNKLNEYKLKEKNG